MVYTIHGREWNNRRFGYMKDLHVKQQGKEWTVEAGRSKKIHTVHPTKNEAIDVARAIAINRGLVVVIYGEDGKVRSRSGYGR